MPHIKKQMISFFLTTKCNLRCVYCYNSKERKMISEKSLPLHIAKAGLDYFLSTNGNKHIRFYGPGEPTMEFELLKDITSYAKEKLGNDVLVEMQTNGCFGENVRNWVLDNVNIIWISFDGPPDIQNTNRPCANGKNSSNIIESNVRWLHRNMGNRNLMIGARVTITDINLHRQKELVDYFDSIGIKHVWTDPLFPSVDKIPVFKDEEKKQSFSFDMDKYVDKYLDAYKYAKGKSMFYGSFLICNFDGKCSKHCRACTPVPHITPDGYISACDMVTFGENAHHMDCFVYGRWNEDKNSFEFDEKKIKDLQERSVHTMEHCQKCSVKEYCGGYCLGEVVNETGSLKGQKKDTCRAIKKLFKELGPQEAFDYLHP